MREACPPEGAVAGIAGRAPGHVVQHARARRSRTVRPAPRCGHTVMRTWFWRGRAPRPGIVSTWWAKKRAMVAWHGAAARVSRSSVRRQPRQRAPSAARPPAHRQHRRNLRENSADKGATPPACHARMPRPHVTHARAARGVSTARAHADRARSDSGPTRPPSIYSAPDAPYWQQRSGTPAAARLRLRARVLSPPSFRPPRGRTRALLAPPCQSRLTSRFASTCRRPAQHPVFVVLPARCFHTAQHPLMRCRNIAVAATALLFADRGQRVTSVLRVLRRACKTRVRAAATPVP